MRDQDVCKLDFLPTWMLQILVCELAHVCLDDDTCKAEDNFVTSRQNHSLEAALKRLCNCNCIRLTPNVQLHQLMWSNYLASEV